MARIKFDKITNNPIPPQFVLAKRNGEKIGNLIAHSITVANELNNPNQISFDVYKYTDEKLNFLWDEIKNFRLVWCEDYNTWYQIQVDITESNQTVKHIILTSLYEAELSQLSLNSIEINTEDDIDREDYVVSVLWDGTKNSILERILSDKASHYSVIHVDSTIANIQRMFSFDGITIYDAFKQIEEEIGCIFVFGDTETDDEDISIVPNRMISVYDMMSNCHHCGYRGEYTNVCPHCGSTNISEGYGKDTTIFISSDTFADNIRFETNVDAVKNCFRLVSGDEDMDAVIRNINPSGSNYIWHFSDEMMQDMSDGLRNKISGYDELYRRYNETETYSLNVNAYNTLVDKYLSYKDDLNIIPTSVTGYSSLSSVLYDTTDFKYFLEYDLMPDYKLPNTSASLQAGILNSSQDLKIVSVNNTTSLSNASADNAVLGMVKVLADARYKYEIIESSLTEKSSGTYTWIGKIKIENYYDEDDYALTNTITCEINNDYEKFLEQKVEKALAKENADDLDIASLFKKSIDAFTSELKKYGLSSLKRFYDCAEGILGILQEQGSASNNGTTFGREIYDDYYAKQGRISAEMSTRESEIKTVDGVITAIYKIKDDIVSQLDFKKYIGLYWDEFCSFRRDGEYQNENYISDGLTNQELFENAKKFLQVANEEIYKSSELQHSIYTNLYNLLCIKEFKPFLDLFDIGNWIRVKVDDEVYKLRLIRYEIDFDNLRNIAVEFSDVTTIANGISDIKSIIDSAKTMATSYDAIARQVDKSEKISNDVSKWFSDGLNLTNVNIVSSADNQSQLLTRNGMLLRKYDDITDSYYPEQMKLINGTIAITKDNWESVETAIGRVYYVDPIDGDIHETYGVNAQTVIGDLLVGSSLRLKNSDNSLLFDGNGLAVNSDDTTLNINTSSDYIQRITYNDNDVFYVNKSGGAFLRGGLIAGSNNEVQINPNGTFDFGNGKLVYDGSSLSIGGYPTTSEMNSAIQNAVTGNTLVVTLSKQYYPVFVNPDGSIGVFPEITVSATVYHEGIDVTDSATITAIPDGCSGTYDNIWHTYRVTTLPENNATVTFNATYEGASASAVFSLSKVVANTDNTSFTYALETGTDIIYRKVSNTFSPKTISVKGYMISNDTKSILENDYRVSSYYILDDGVYSNKGTTNPDIISRISFSIDLGSPYYTYDGTKYLKQALVLELYKVNANGDDILLVKKTIPISIDANALFVQDALDNDKTYINGSAIATGTISAKQIDVENLFSKDIVASGKIVSPRLVTSDYTYTTGNANYFADSGFIVDLQQGVIRSEVFAVTTSGNPYFCQTIHVCDKRDKAKVIATLGGNGIRVDDVVQIGSDSATFQGSITAQGHSSAIGTILNGTGEGSIPDKTGTVLASRKLTSGTWMITFTVAFPTSSGTGTKRISISTSSSGAVSLSPSTTVASGSVRDSERKILQKTRCINIESDTTYYLSAYQNSGNTEAVSYAYEIARIS